MVKVTYTTLTGKKNTREFALKKDAEKFIKEATEKGWAVEANNPKAEKAE